MRLCVIVPAMNEERVIGSTIRSILAAGMDAKDIFVINDGSKDRTGEIASDLGVNVFTNPVNIGKARSVARLTNELRVGNQSLCEAYEIICMMDADTLVDPEYFRHVNTAFLMHPEAVAVAGTAKSRKHNWITSYRFLMYAVSHFVYKDGQSSMGAITVIPGCAASYRASAFAQLEWSHDTIVEDMDVTIQVHRKKLGKIIYVPKAVVHTQDPSNIRDYCKQAYRWHCGAWQIGKKYGMFTGLTKIDLEWKLLMFEGLIFGALLLVSPIWLTFHLRPAIAGVAFMIDATVLTVLSLICAIWNRRPDVILYSPVYQVLRFVDCGVFLYSFWVTIVRGQHVNGWMKVTRYEGKEKGITA
jgi:poly-beta-1,6-N-acetyl-D-glucosamine synthase